MINPFKDQAWFMQACGQQIDGSDLGQYAMYMKLIDEEVGELHQAVLAQDEVEQLDALIDILVVTIGAIHSAGYNAEGAWEGVMRSNAAKIDLDTGKVRRREDGKILKPDGWVPPNLAPYIKKEK